MNPGNSARNTGKRYLTFELGEETYGMDILSVKELQSYGGITPLPRTPDYIKGIINLRGQIVPVVDLRLRFGMAPVACTKSNGIIVCEFHFEEEKLLMGLLVDNVDEVITLPDEALAPVNYVRARVKAEYIKAVATRPEGIIVLLDVERILREDEFAQLKPLDQAPAPQVLASK